MFLFSKKQQARSPKTGAAKRAPVTTYYRSDTPSDTASPFKKKTAKKNHRKFLFGFLDILIIFIFLFGLGYSLMLKPQSKIIASSLSFHSAADYTAVANAKLSSLKNRNKITFNEHEIVNALQKQFPEISVVQVELPFFSEQPTIRLIIARPSFQLSSKGMNYIVSSSGIIAAKSADLPNIKNLITVSDQSGFNAAVGKPILSADAVAFINTLIVQCQHSKVPIASITLPATPQELDLRTSDQPYYVKFYLGGDVVNETGQFLAARNHFTQTKQPPDQYLDVRVAGKIFYK